MEKYYTKARDVHTCDSHYNATSLVLCSVCKKLQSPHTDVEPLIKTQRLGKLLDAVSCLWSWRLHVMCIVRALMQRPTRQADSM